MLRSTWRGLETWHGRDGVTLANERARQQGTQTSTYTGAPVLDPTDERDVETELWSGYLGTARRKGRQQITRAYRHRATSRLYKSDRLFRVDSSRSGGPPARTGTVGQELP